MIFFIDRDLGHAVPRALQLVRDDVIYLAQRYPDNTPDEKWLADAGKNEWIVITRNRKIGTNPAHVQAVRDHKFRCFCLIQRKPLNRWQMLSRLVKSWESIEETAGSTSAPLIGIREDGSFRTMIA